MPKNRNSSEKESIFTFSHECSAFTDREDAAAKRIKKNPSKLFRIAMKVRAHGSAKEKHRLKLDKELESLFVDPTSFARAFRRPDQGLDHLEYLEYTELRARRLRASLYSVIKHGGYHQEAMVCLYWLRTDAPIRQAVQEAVTGPENTEWHWVMAEVYRALYRRTIRYLRSIKVEKLRVRLERRLRERRSLHPNLLVRRAWTLARGAELSSSVPLLHSESVLPPHRFDCTPCTFLDYLKPAKRDEQEAETLFGQSAGILDSGLFYAEFDELFKEEVSWTSLHLRTKRSMEKELPKKFRWVESLKPQKTMQQVRLSQKTKDDLLRLADHHKVEVAKGKVGGLTLLFRGEPGTGKSLTAEALAQWLGMDLLRVNFSAVDSSKISDIVTFFACRAERTNSVLLFEECENIFRGNLFRGTSDGWAKILFQGFKGVAIFTTNYDLGYGMARRMTYVHEFEPETPEIRQKILMQEIEAAVQASGVITAYPEPERLLELVCKHEVPGGYFKSVIQLAMARSPKGEIYLEALEHAFDQRAKVMDAGKSSLESPKVSLADVVLRPEQRKTVERIVELAKTNRTSHPLLPKCVSAIFHGPPGTGKTLVAEAIAHGLGKRIYKATSADLLSMYVGESEKAIRRLFQNAAAQGYVLFIDEAEGLFRDRSTAVRSWELTQVNELLRQFDEFEGIVLLASNHKDAIDPAFARRIQFHVDFPMPSQDERKDLWQKFLGITKIVLEESDLRLLTEGFTLSGGEIRNAVVQAQAHGVTDILRLCEICKGIESQRFGRSQRRVGLN